MRYLGKNSDQAAEPGNRVAMSQSAEDKWPFLDPPNTAVFTSVRILDDEDWVHYVTHDQEDGARQFHPLR